MEFREFNPMMIFITPISAEMRYSESKTYDGKTIQWGQLKLLTGEILFLINHCEANLYENGIVFVVAGGAPGNHYPILLELFPIIKRLDLWDTVAFTSHLDKYGDRVRLYKEYMTKERIEQVYGFPREDIIFFASDIRTATNEGVERGEYTSAERDEIIWSKDHELQRVFVETLRPVEALLKYKPPFVLEEGEDIIGTDTLRYFKGIIYTQAFNRIRSTETRLVPLKDGNGNYIYEDFSRLKYERQLMYYNTNVRQSSKWTNNINGSSSVLDKELVDCFDTYFLMYVLDKYMYYIGVETSDSSDRYSFVMLLWTRILTMFEEILGKSINLSRSRELVFSKKSVTLAQQQTATGSKVTLPDFLKNPRNITARK